MIWNEIKKTLIYFKGIILIIIALVIVIAINYKNCSYKKKYLDVNTKKEVIREFQGKYNEEKLNKLYQTRKEYLSNDFQSTMDAYYEGKINATQYFEAVEVENNNIKMSGLLGQTIELYEYAEEDTSRRYIVFQEGWRMLLTQSSNWMIIVVILFFSLVIFSFDAGSKVMIMTDTSVNGRNRLLWCRIATFCILTIISITIYGFINYLCIAKMIGLPGMEYPVQSLIFFGDSGIKCSLFGGYVYQLVYLLLACLFSGGVVCLIVTIFNDKYIAFLLGAFLFFFSFIFSGDNLNKFIPLKGYYSLDILLGAGSVIGMVVIIMEVAFVYLGAGMIKRVRA